MFILHTNTFYHDVLYVSVCKEFSDRHYILKLIFAISFSLPRSYLCENGQRQSARNGAFIASHGWRYIDNIKRKRSSN